MYDFLRVERKYNNKLQRNVYSPTYVIKSNIKDLLIRGQKFYAIYNYETGLWETDDSVATTLIDDQVRDYVDKNESPAFKDDPDHSPIIMRLSDSQNHLINQWHMFCERDYRPDWDPKCQLNQKIIFSNTDVKRSDYASKKLSYPLVDQPTPYYDKICEKLYLPEEREKWEWYIGCLIAGDQDKIQKMLVFYGEPGTGKSTIIGKVIADTLFEGFEMGYVSKFEANNLVGRNEFATDFLEKDPVLVYDDDAEMNMITSKTTLNKIISHEAIRVNAKFEKAFVTRPHCLMIVGSNEPVQMSPNSGMNRRLIDVRPTGNRLSPDEYDECIEHLQFEKSGIAWRCLQVYKKHGPHYYDHYVAEDMLSRTSPFQNFVKENYLMLKDGCSLAAAYKLYCDYAEECKFKNVLARYKFRDTLKLYFKTYENMKFSGFKYDRIGLEDPDKPKEEEPIKIPVKAFETWIDLKEQSSLFDAQYADYPAQYEQEDSEHPLKYAWANCKTKLKDLDTKKIHYVKGPSNLIFLDFDKKGPNGEKDLASNIEAASKFPKTYAEVSKGGGGLHLFYIYTGGDPDKLSRIYDDNIEVKIPKGGSSIRRRLSLCNDIPIAEISSGLPLKEERSKDVVDWKELKDERYLRNFIGTCILKKHHGHTRPEVNFIYDALERAYAKGFKYDVRDLETDVFCFAASSTNSAQYCMEMVEKMHFCSKDIEDTENVETEEYKTAPIIFLDCEIAPSAQQALADGVKLYDDCPEDTPALFLIEWKYQGTDSSEVKAMINPKPSEIEKLFKYRIIAHNAIGYDSSMVYAASQGYTPEELYRLSQKLVSKDKEISNKARLKGSRYLFYADTYEYPVNKQNLKQWEIDLGIHHQEWGREWNQPVPTSQIDTFVGYCKNDVVSLEAVFNATHSDFVAKEMLVDLVPGSSMIESTNTISTKFVKGDDDHLSLVYTDFTTGKQYGDGVPYEMPIISQEEYEALGDDWTGVKPINKNQFPGYHLVRGKDGKLHNMFRGIDLGRGGYVYSNPGMYWRAVTKDSNAHHPHSIKELNLFGEKQTARYFSIIEARNHIKHGEFDEVKKMFNGKLAKYLTDTSDKKKVKALSTAMKLIGNAFYGMTSSPHDYFEAKDPRNINNIVALRGAIVLKIIQDEVEARGFKVIHIKTDSIKIADPTDEILSLVDKIGEYYGYKFEIEHTWNRICLVDKAQFIGLHDSDDPDSPMTWDATGKMFQVPYIYKTLFTHEPIEFKDMCVTFNVKAGSLHLVFDEGTDKEADTFIGRVGEFVPVWKGHGGHLYRVNDGKRYAAAGSTNKLTKEKYEWLESEEINRNHLEDIINKDYFFRECNEAIETIQSYGDYDQFVTINTEPAKDFMPVPDSRDEVPFDHEDIKKEG